VRRESEWLDLEQVAAAMDTEEGRAQLRAGLRRAVAGEQRRPAWRPALHNTVVQRNFKADASGS
jgi:hypothetical protein